ncbi:LacI family DNA-binding transcriptional regulator [Nonomuraea candida]|uniref:LacI family DNA-binding transcriptional regulator n=1 Tax=Nonomuraea candida TaxID=359159 RepID=UPI0005BA7B59|nr:LacI family DNA-binding transcriptional regulator [Nonomuraea candida]
MTGVRRRMPRQADVARLAGVSQATVSAVINGRAREAGIPEQTVRRVEDAVRRLGYVANAAARSLKGKGNRLIGVHSFESMFPIDQLDFYHEFLIGIEQQAVADGYDLVLFASTESADGRRHIYRDGANRLALADGSVLIGVEHNASDLARLAGEGYPFVHIGRRTVPDAEISWVSADYATATAGIVGRLAALGHRRIGYVTSTERVDVHMDKESGYRAGCAAAGLPELMYVVDTAQVTDPWLDAVLATGVTALLLEGAEIATLVAALLDARGLTVPGDLSAAVLVNLPAVGAPRWSSLRIPRNEMGRMAVKLLIDLLADPGATPARHVLLPCEQLDELTIAPPKA